MMYLSEMMAKRPIVPYIREGDFAIRKPWTNAERRILDYLMVYFQEGSCVFTIDGVPYEFGSGEFCLIQPGSLNLLEGKTNTITPFVHLDFFYDELREERFPTRGGQTDISAYAYLMQPKVNDFNGIDIPVKLSPKKPIVLRDKFIEMVKCWQHRDPLNQLRAQSLATDIILTILEDHTDLKEAEKTAPQPLNWITSFFSFNLSEPLTVNEMAKRANLSPSRFSAKFREQFGVPPHRYLLELRIAHAKDLLATSELRLEEIAEYCGFADIHHFTKAFKKMADVSPGAYRKQTSIDR